MNTRPVKIEEDDFLTKLKKVREEMREIKAEYARVELQFNDFDFNNQMVEALIGEDDKKLAPYADLFNQQVENLCKRYETCERANQLLIESFTKMNEQHVQVTTPAAATVEKKTVKNKKRKTAILIDSDSEVSSHFVVDDEEEDDEDWVNDEDEYGNAEYSPVKSSRTSPRFTSSDKRKAASASKRAKK